MRNLATVASITVLVSIGGANLAQSDDSKKDAAPALAAKKDVPDEKAVRALIANFEIDLPAELLQSMREQAWDNFMAGLKRNAAISIDANALGGASTESSM